MATIQLQTVKVTPNLERFALEVLPSDIQRTIQYVYIGELEAQRRLGAVPTTQLVDNGRGQLFSVKRRAQAFFSNPGRIKSAAREAYDRLVSLTRIKTGAARRSFMVYVNERPIGGIDALETIVKAMGPGDFISIVGPGVAYGRKLYWRPYGKARQIKKKKLQYTQQNGQTVIVKGVYTEPMHRTVKRLLAKKYPDLSITDRWIPLNHGTGRKGERWPAISIRMKSSRQTVGLQGLH
jgi:hypothetical protein